MLTANFSVVRATTCEEIYLPPQFINPIKYESTNFGYAVREKKKKHAIARPNYKHEKQLINIHLNSTAF